MRLPQVFSLNTIAFYFSFHDSDAVLSNTGFVDSFSDSVWSTGFNLISHIEEHVVDNKLYEYIY